MIVVYTGNGKGKTSATLGQVVRARGHGLKVAYGQFMKKDGQAGEQVLIKELVDDVHIAGPGFLLAPEDLPQQRQCGARLLAWAHSMLERVDVLVLDEALYALGYNIITEQDLKHIIDRTRVLGKDLILSGRGLPDWLLECADLISEINEIKHPYQQGISAKKGIDF